MKPKTTLATVVLTGILAVLFGAIAVQDAVADGRSSPVGSWMVEVSPDSLGPPPFTNLATLTSDGLVINFDPTVQAAGHGVWVKTGRHKLAAFFITLDGDRTITVESPSLLISRNGDRITGEFTTVISDPSMGDTSFGGMVEFTRITFPDDLDKDNDDDN